MKTLKTGAGKTGVRRMAALCLTAAFAAGCGNSAPIVKVDTQFSSIVFGVTKPTPSPIPVPSLPPDLGSPDFGGPFYPDIPIDITLPPLPSPAPDPCPAAQPGAAARDVAPTTPTSGPIESKFKWTVTVNDTPTTGQGFTSSGFTKFGITNIKSYPDTTSQTSANVIHHFTYDWVLPIRLSNGTHGTEVESFRVKSYSDINNPPSAGGLPPPVPPTSPPTAGTDPDGGVVLYAIQYKDASGKAFDSWQPPSQYDATTGTGKGGDLVLSLPVQGGATYGGYQDTDPQTQWTIAVPAQNANTDGTTTPGEIVQATRVKVDACGQLIDGWQTVDQFTVTKKSEKTGQPVTYKDTITYTYATQYGAIPIAMNITGNDEDGGRLTVDARIAEVPPIPS